jgi:hypothetical protein
MVELLNARVNKGESMKAINSFIAMFDFLGFKNQRKERGTEDIYQLYKRGLLPQIQHAAALKAKTIKRGDSNVYAPDFGPQSIDYRIVSDSIILFAKGDGFEQFLKIIAASHNLLCSGFAGHKAPLRGAIGYGDFICDPNSIWLGSAIEDAYIGESKQVWSGCSLTKSCETFVKEKGYIQQHINLLDVAASQEQDSIKRKNIEKAKKRLVEYEIPEQRNPKTGPVEYTQRLGYALDWTLNVYEGAGEKGFAASKSNHAKTIIENTKQFESWARSNNR